MEKRPQLVVCGALVTPEKDEVRHFARWINNFDLHLGYIEFHYMLLCHVFPWIFPGSCFCARNVIKNMSSSYQQGIFALLVTLSDWPTSGIFHREKPFQKHVCQHFLGGADKSVTLVGKEERKEQEEEGRRRWGKMTHRNWSYWYGENKTVKEDEGAVEWESTSGWIHRQADQSEREKEKQRGNESR